MSNNIRLVALLALLSYGTLATGCVDRDGKTTVAVKGDHAGHDEGSSGEHAGHDEHGSESAEEHAGHDEHGGESAEEHAGHDEHGGESAEEHAGHDEKAAEEAGGHAHAEIVELGPDVLRKYGVVVATAKPGKLLSYLSLPGEVAIDTDHVAHVVTPITGVVASVHKNVGDTVKRGALMIELDSMELAESKSRYLETLQHRKLAKSTLEREEKLWKQGISAEREYLQAKNDVAEAEIAVSSAKQMLKALKVPQGEIDKLPGNPGANLTRYRVYASAGGRVVEKHVSVGELLTPEQEAFTLADLSTVWVKLSLHQRDIERVRVGQAVTVTTPDGKGQVQARVEFIEPLIGEETRMATARVKLSNPQGDWRPGLFVTGKVVVDSQTAALLIPLDAVQTVAGKTVVFVQDEHGFETRTVTLGRENDDQVEVTDGLQPGESYVAVNAFLVKAELGKATAEHAH
ncbi:MAG: efflux RND transporter periplasmic adaptor subunit [bacterium]|nr:efflux RND transporter periplasmic adaptor subunit [bacterium]